MRYQMTLDNSIIVDNFAGGGGASTGLEMALGRPVNIAVNHDVQAIGLHEVNHPQTTHFCENVFSIDPVAVCKGRPVLAAWFSPDCTHHSKAKGGKPRKKHVRGLAWIVVRWARTVRPRLIFLENVEEFQEWGPLTVDGKPDPARKGQTFQFWKSRLERLGYKVEHHVLKASDFGAPTIRKRLFLIARCDGEAIVWPEPTHGDPKKFKKGSKLKPWRTAAECIDWNLPCPSIFSRPRPLAENTLRRVAKGFRRFVLDADRPFIVTCNHSGDGFRGQGIDEPMKTICASRDAHGVVVPYLTEHANASSPRVFAADEPLRTQCANVKGGHFAMVAPYLAGVGGRAGQSRPRSADEPVATMTTKADTVIVGACLIGAGGPAYSGKPASIEQPFGTLVAENHKQLVAPYVVKHFGGMTGVRIDTPLPTTTTRGTQNQIAAAYVTKMRGDNVGHEAGEPLHTVSAGGTHHAVTTAYLVKYYGNEKEGQDIAKPIGTVTTKDRFGLLQVEGLAPPLTDEERYSAWWTMRFLEAYEVCPPSGDVIPGPRPSFLMLGDFVVWDIGMRMLVPRELYRAQSFPEGYKIDHFMAQPEPGVKVFTPLPKTGQVRMCGNSVPPVMAEVVARHNVPRTGLMEGMI